MNMNKSESCYINEDEENEKEILKGKERMAYCMQM